MRTLASLAVLCLAFWLASGPVGTVALAQPAGSAGSGSAAGSAAAPAAGSAAAPAAGSAAPAGSAAAGGSAASAAPADMPAPPPSGAGAVDPNRKACTDAMNADPTFRDAILATLNKNVEQEHRRAAAAIAKNEKHVILAYAAMWIVAAAFVLFLWRRQQLLKIEIATLRRDLDAAAKDGK